MSQSFEPTALVDPDAPRPRRWWRRLWRERNDRRQAVERLYRAAVNQARTPALFGALGVPDTPEGRFETIALHTALVLRRLRREGDRGQLIGQELFDLMFADMDSGLRELGVSDLSVGKYVKRLAGNFLARLAALDEGLANPSSLHPMLRDNIYHGSAAPSEAQVRALADYLVAQEQALSNQDGEALCVGRIVWVAPEAASQSSRDDA